LYGRIGNWFRQWLAGHVDVEVVLRWFSAAFLYTALDERLTLSEAVKQALGKKVEPHALWVTWCMGGTALLLFFNQVITGILLAMYYKPSAEAAYDSVRYIETHVTLGWLVRQMHAWGAHLMIIVVIVHMLRVFFNRAYRPPRELTWVAGSLLLMVTMAFAFTGYLLPWDQLSYWASTVGTQLAEGVPLVGGKILILMRGGPSVTHLTLSRFFAIHTIVLPAVAAALMAAHFVVIRRLGISEPM